MRKHVFLNPVQMLLQIITTNKLLLLSISENIAQCVQAIRITFFLRDCISKPEDLKTSIQSHIKIKLKS